MTQAIPPAATAEGTKRYQNRFSQSLATEHFRDAQGLTVSTIGLGTYLGNPDPQTDENYRKSIIKAVQLGCNLIDSAANYRFQRSERSIGAALAELVKNGDAGRDEIVICTKGGFIPFDGAQPDSPLAAREYVEQTFIRPGIATPSEIVNGQCVAPRYLEHQLNQSLRNLQLDAIDVYYIHNPESQLNMVRRDEFNRRMRAAFELLEKKVADGKIRFYGTATWSGYRQQPDERDYLSLPDLETIAHEVGGENHHFRFIQLPYNLAMPEALTLPNQTLEGDIISVLDAALHLDINVICSASLRQAQLAEGLPGFIHEAMQGARTDAQRAIQFVRSTPSVTAALVGMSHVTHVTENMELAKIPPASTKDFLKLFTSHEE